MSKKILTILLFLVISLPQIHAQIEQTGGYTRFQSLGNNYYIIDPFFVNVNPAWSGFYPNFIWGDIGFNNGTSFGNNGGGQFFAANFNLGYNMTLGGLLSRHDFNGGGISYLDPGQSIMVNQNVTMSVVNLINQFPEVNQATINMDNNIEIMGSYILGKLAFGLGLAYASTTNQNNPAVGQTTEGNASQFGVNGGMIADFTNNMKLDLGVSLLLPGASYKDSVGESKVSETIILINGRFFYKFSEKFTLVPVVQFATLSASSERGALANPPANLNTDMPSATQLLFGIGINYRVGPVLIAGGPSLVTSSLTIPGEANVSPELKNSIFAFPIWNIGLEWQLLDWLTGRMGYVARTADITEQSAATANSVNEHVFTSFSGTQGFKVGIGIRLGNFSLDGLINTDVLRQGLNNIGGGGATFAYLSSSYSFN